jgi:nucleotide-binding universal stress UspA family protein
MKTVIVPVDFSDTSLNAARYAVQLLTGHYGVEMILYHVYEKDSHAAEVKNSLDDLKKELMNIGIVKINPLAEKGNNFVAELEKLVRHREADLIIMGITGRSPIGQALMGSNTFKIVEEKVCPVLIIPANATYKEVKNVLLTCDFKDVKQTIPSVPIKKILKTFLPNLFIINVDSEHYVALTEGYQAEKQTLQDMFAEFHPQFFFLGWYEVDEAINQFAKDKNIDFIITVPKERNLFEKMFTSSRTRKLAYHSDIPVLAVHE